MLDPDLRLHGGMRRIHQRVVIHTAIGNPTTMQGRSLIAVCDILGFTDLVATLALDEVVDTAVGWFRKTLKHSVVGGDFPSEPPPTRELESHKNIGVAWFSDTVLFYTKHDTDEAVGELLQTVAALLFETILQGTTKVRAGISYGEAHLDAVNSIFVGLPIVEAHHLEKLQEWAGAALTKSACDRVRACGAISGEVARYWIVEWDVPLKGGSVERTYAVDWNKGVHLPEWRLKWSSVSDHPPARDQSSVAMKFANTRIFHVAHCDVCATETLQAPDVPDAP